MLPKDPIESLTSLLPVGQCRPELTLPFGFTGSYDQRGICSRPALIFRARTILGLGQAAEDLWAPRSLGQWFSCRRQADIQRQSKVQMKAELRLSAEESLPAFGVGEQEAQRWLSAPVRMTHM